SPTSRSPTRRASACTTSWRPTESCSRTQPWTSSRERGPPPQALTTRPGTRVLKRVRPNEVAARRDHPPGGEREVVRGPGRQPVHVPGPPGREQDRDQGGDPEDLE